MTRQTLYIERLGHRGDGIARPEARPDASPGAQTVFVPGALPGETVTADVERDRAHNIEIVTASPRRTVPPCPHFGTCGGCALQHMDDELRHDFARDQLHAALHDRGLETVFDEVITVPQHSRRRATLAALKLGNRTVVGFHARESHHIVPIETCAVLAPQITGHLRAFHDLAAIAAPKKGPLDIAVTQTDTGHDVALRNLVPRDRERLRLPLSEIAERHNLARLSLDDEIVVERFAPSVTIAGIAVSPPPGGFLQASRQAEAAMGELVTRLAGKAETVADLYAGCGTFTLHLARHRRVHAVEGDAASLAALDRAVRHARGLRSVTTERRDLVQRPLLPAELARFDLVVFDPPRAGAREQAERLAASKVPHVIAISCNPATFARDARILVDGGLSLRSVTPVAQFLYSPHLELVAEFNR